jgi:hypothetical protein
MADNTTLSEPLIRLRRLRGWERLVSDYWVGAKACTVGCGVSFLGYDIVRWLKSGDWDASPSSSLIIFLTNDRWLISPKSWLGIHDLVVRLSGLPAFITYTAFIWLVAGTVYLVAKSGVEHSIRQLKKQTGVQDAPDGD